MLVIKQLAFVCFSVLLVSCGDKPEELDLQKELSTDSTVKSNQIVFTEPQIIDSSKFVIYPLLFEKVNYAGSSGYSGGGRNIYWNLIFYNPQNGESRLLVNNQKVLINAINSTITPLSLMAVNRENGINSYKKYIIYSAVSKDYNLNNLLDQQDPNYLFVSDREGSNFRQVSPEDYHIVSWKILKGTTKILMQSQKDDNGNQKFDNADKIIPLVVDLNTGKMASEIFSPKYIDSLKQELINTWKTPKK